MGMYTQVRGFLGISSIAYGIDEDHDLQKMLEDAKTEFKATCVIDRTWCADYTWINGGSNGAFWIFIGCEFKNYGDVAQAWVEFIVNKFPSAEGRVEFHYEEQEPGDDIEVWLIGSIHTHKDYRIKKLTRTTHCTGYGNEFKPFEEKAQVMTPSAINFDLNKTCDEEKLKLLIEFRDRVQNGTMENTTTWVDEQIKLIEDPPRS